ncbi:MAG: hypothetical protein U0869_21895 [Chloroflexota bacterium]
MGSETKPTVLDLWVCPDCGDVVRVADDDRTGWRCCNQEMVRRRALVLDDALAGLGGDPDPDVYAQAAMAVFDALNGEQG